MERADVIRFRALRLARSGRHIDCFTIEKELEAEGFSEAGEVLYAAGVRRYLTQLCEPHWRARTVSLLPRHRRPRVIPFGNNDNAAHFSPTIQA
jgi:hypothetical protein